MTEGWRMQPFVAVTPACKNLTPLTTVVLSTFSSAFNTFEWHQRIKKLRHHSLPSSALRSALLLSVWQTTGYSLLLSFCLPPFFLKKLCLYPFVSVFLIALLLSSSHHSSVSTHHTRSPSRLYPRFSLLYPPLLVSHFALVFAISFSPLCPSRSTFQFHSLPLRSLCKSSLIHSQ